MAATDIHLEFPDDQTRDDFEVAFRGWLKQYQQSAGLAKALTGGGGGGGAPAGSTGGLTGGGGHSFGAGGGGGGEAGLISLGGGSYGGASIKDFYLNFIPGW